MLEKETQSLLTTIADRTIGRREKVSLKEITTAEIPRSVKVYIRTEVIRWLNGELTTAPRFSQIDRSTPGAQQLTEAFLRSLCGAYEFSREDFLSLLNDAVHFTENYLCRPQWTLENFVFDRQNVVPVQDLRTKLEYLSEYVYFPRLIEKLVTQWAWKEVAKDNFRMLVSKIDAQIVRQHSAQELAMLTKPIYDFLGLGDASMNRAVPLEPLLLFFDDKRMKTLRDHIESICSIRRRSELTLRELTGLVEDLYQTHPITGGTAPSPDQELPTSSVTDPLAEFRPAAPSGRREVTAMERAMELQLDAADRAIQAAFTGQEATPESPPPPPPPPQPVPAAEPRGILMDLNDLITGKQRSRFVRRVFNRDRAYYNVVIDELNRITAWKEASAYLNDFYRANKLDPFADDVVLFTDTIQSRYRPPVR